MFKQAVWLVILVCAVSNVHAVDGNLGVVQSITPGLDSMPPVLSSTYIGCGVYEFTATELRNIPDPPIVPPRVTDQVDKGIASVSIVGSPTSVNTKLTLITDQSFPRDNAYKTFTFRIEPLDPTQTAYAYIYVRDWAGNLASQQLVIEPPIPLVTPRSQTTQTRVNTTSTVTVNVTNNTDKPQTVSVLDIVGSTTFTITGGGAVPFTLGPGESRVVTVTYTPTLDSDKGDEATLNVRTDCGNTPVSLSGTGLLARLVTEDWDAGTTTVNLKICKQDGFRITNNGNAAVTITGFSSNNPNVTISSTISAVNPARIEPGNSLSVTELCYQRASVGSDVADVSVICDAEAGDLICKVTASVQVSSVDPEIIRAINVRYDASTQRVLFNDDRAAILIDIMGATVATAPSEQRHLHADALAAGTYFVVFVSHPAVALPVVITQ